MLGNMYSSGEGVERNDKEAIRWYHKAVKQGYPHAGEDLDRLLERMRRESQQKEERPESSASSSGERLGTATGTRPQITPSVFLRKRTGSPEEGKDERPGVSVPQRRMARLTAVPRNRKPVRLISGKMSGVSSSSHLPSGSPSMGASGGLSSSSATSSSCSLSRQCTTSGASIMRAA